MTTQPTTHYDGTQAWYVQGQLHRIDGPALDNGRGYQVWCLDGRNHRIGGPAVIMASGRREWYVHGRRHRIDGPAVEYPQGTGARGREWWLRNRMNLMSVRSSPVTAWQVASAVGPDT